jgi:hypothetical protein
MSFVLMPDELRSRMIEHIMRRDRLTLEQAQAAFECLNKGDLTMLELEIGGARRGTHTADYDPCAWNQGSDSATE